VNGNNLEKSAEKNYKQIIDSHADMVNLNCPDIMIDLMKLFQLLRHEKEMSGN